MDYENFLNQFTSYIFVEDKPQPSDIIFIPGNGYPQMAEYAAKLWKEGMAPYILPSGKYSILTGRFEEVKEKQDQYQGEYATEYEFLKSVLLKNQVPEKAIIKEDQATYTYENAIYSRKVTDQMGLSIHRAIVCCKAQHARRCKLYYQLLYPQAHILICPVKVDVSREDWFLSDRGIEQVLGEIERCGKQFHQILGELKK